MGGEICGVLFGQYHSIHCTNFLDLDLHRVDQVPPLYLVYFLTSNQINVEQDHTNLSPSFVEN